MVTSPVEKVETFDYFVRCNLFGATMDTWVANDIVVDFEKARENGKNFADNAKFIPIGTPEAAAFIEQLPTHVRELVGSLEGAIYLRWRDTTYLVPGGC